MNFLREKLISLLEGFKLSEFVAELSADIIVLVGLLTLAVLFYFLIRFVYSMTVKKFGLKSKNIFVRELVKNPLVLTIIKIIPTVILHRITVPLVSIFSILDILFNITTIFLIVKVITSVLDLTNTLYESRHKDAGLRPIKGIINFAKAIIFFLAIIIVIADLADKSLVAILTGLGAMSAVLMLIFKDAILGLVAGFQMSGNDLVRLGDWIELPKYNVDGHVIDITLTFVKVENWDKTIVTVPAYILISDSFTNWRNVFDSGGRRIKRSINIDTESVKVIDDELYEKLLKVDLIKDYLNEKKEEITEHNKDVDTTVSLNGRRLTNLGVFRIYITEYLKQHRDIHKDMWILVRQLQYENKGIPLEIYTFSSNTAWASYEAIQADIFDHLYANIGYFDLRVYQEPSGYDFGNRFSK